MRKLILLLAIALHAPLPLLAEHRATFEGKVISISDGDTLTVLDGRSQIKIRLDGIDAPEKSQAFGDVAKKRTSELAFAKVVKVTPTAKDRYGRTIATVTLPDGTELNSELVRVGYAWWYEKYAPHSSKLMNLQALAKEKKLGLWADKNPIPPWQYSKSGNLKPGELSALPLIYANRNSKVFHVKGCKGYFAVSPKNRVPFHSKENALRAGYRIAKNCRL